MNKSLCVLIPGFAGSKLYCNCNDRRRKLKLYPTKYALFKNAIHPHFYECDNVETKILSKYMYKSIYAKMQSELSTPLNDFKIFSYDWRKSPLTLAKELKKFIQEQDLVPYNSIILIGHSLGGLIIRILLEYLNLDLYMNLRTTVFVCGTPMFGSMDVDHFNSGYILGQMLNFCGYMKSTCSVKILDRQTVDKIKPLLFSHCDIMNLMAAFPDSYMYLLPTPFIFALNEKYENGSLLIRNVDLFLEAVQVHKTLNLMKFPCKYNFFFNVNVYRTEKMKIVLVGDELGKCFSFHALQSKYPTTAICQLRIKRLMKSDGLVMPFCNRKVLPNSDIYLDNSQRKTHAFLMNSRKLIALVKICIQNSI